jgi:hypothetical protein
MRSAQLLVCRIAKDHATAGTGVLGNSGELGGEDAFSNFTRPFLV